MVSSARNLVVSFSLRSQNGWYAKTIKSLKTSATWSSADLHFAIFKPGLLQQMCYEWEFDSISKILWIGYWCSYTRTTLLYLRFFVAIVEEFTRAPWEIDTTPTISLRGFKMREFTRLPYSLFDLFYCYCHGCCSTIPIIKLMERIRVAGEHATICRWNWRCSGQVDILQSFRLPPSLLLRQFHALICWRTYTFSSSFSDIRK